ncbi:hypothetical protein KEM54_005484 [Ascosphaera aggregata]|nr:hypothetical protein KEM54_005484 [Ascosphaera aggregata]
MEIIPQVYAELLPNIRQITIYISFPAATSSAIEETRSKGCSISLSNSGDGMLLRYGDRFLRSRLPARAAWPTQEAKEISIRIPADLSSDEAAFANASVEVPWSAKDIQTGTRIGCSNCHHELLRAHTYDTEQSREWIWKDLPSANWAELMELWHCHKPDSPHNLDNNMAISELYQSSSADQLRFITRLISGMPTLLHA